MNTHREAAGRLIDEVKSRVRGWLAAIGPPERWDGWRAGARRQFRLSLLTSALLGICLVLVLTPPRARIETPAFSQLETGTALVTGSVQNRQGQAVVGAGITAVSTSRGTPLADCLTQPDGRYILVLPKTLPEEFTVEITRDHYREAAIALSPSDLQSLRDDRPVVLPPTVLLRSLGPAFWITTLIFLVVLGLMATGKQHNTLAALIGVASLFAVSYLGSAMREDLFIFDFRSALLYVDWNVIFLIMGMMIVIAVVEETGIFQWLAFKSYQLSGGRRWLLLAILMIVTGITSALLDNVTTMLLMAPITVQIALALGMNPLALLMPEVLASNVFGISTLIGTPTNILIGSYARISFSGFLWNLTPGVMLALAGLIVYGEWQYRRELASGNGVAAGLLQKLSERGRILQPEALLKAGWVGAAMLALFLLGDRIHLLPSVTALVGATALLTWIKPDMEKMMEAVDWTTLVFFIAIFIVVGAVQEVGVISFVADGIGWLVGNNLVLAMLAVIWIGAILSTVIANIPFTAAMLPVVAHLSATVPGAENKVLFYCLAVGSAMGGNGSLIGASANMVTAGIAERAGFPITYAYFLKKGAPAVAVTVGLATLWLLLRFYVL
jgi:Na+/H+ antiporter NhaD/arsenite permease-like protein